MTMHIHEERASITIAAGSGATTSLRFRGGLMRQFLVRAATPTTTFRANLVDSSSVTRANWGFHEGEINDVTTSLPLMGTYTINITNGSATDTFTVVIGIEE